MTMLIIDEEEKGWQVDWGNQLNIPHFAKMAPVWQTLTIFSPPQPTDGKEWWPPLPPLVLLQIMRRPFPQLQTFNEKLQHTNFQLLCINNGAKTPGRYWKTSKSTQRKTYFKWTWYVYQERKTWWRRKWCWWKGWWLWRMNRGIGDREEDGNKMNEDEEPILYIWKTASRRWLITGFCAAGPC